MSTKLFFSKGAADRYINEWHHGEYAAKTSIDHLTQCERMAAIPGFAGECSAVDFGDETVAWFHEPCGDDEIAMIRQLGALGVRLYAMQELNDGAVFALADIDEVSGLTRDVPVVYYREGDTFTFFTPDGWQGWMPESPDEIEDADWREILTGKPAVILNGLPRLF